MADEELTPAEAQAMAAALAKDAAEEAARIAAENEKNAEGHLEGATVEEILHTRKEYIRLTVDAGVPPLELRFYPIVDVESGAPIAYRTKTTIHSVILGEMEEGSYTYVTDRRACGIELLKHNVQHAFTAIRAFAEAGREDVKFITVRCPAELAYREDLYEIVSHVVEKNPATDKNKLCLEFPAPLLDADKEKAGRALKDMKILGLRTAIVGCGEESFPVSKLLSVTPDIVFLDPSATEWAGSRNKPQLLSSFVSYIRSMGMDAIAEGTEKERRAMRGSDCIGFAYTDGEGISAEEAIAQKPEED